MTHRLRLLLDGAASLAVLTVLAVPSLSGQEAGRGAPAPDDATAARRAAQAESAQEQPAATERRPGRKEIMLSMRDSEIRHRERLAAIHRLRQIAEAQGQAERLALLDKLEVTEMAHHLTVAQGAANRLGDTSAYKQSLLKLASGRIRRNVPPDKAVEPGETPAERKARKQAAKEAAKQAEAAGGAATERAAAPKADDTQAEVNRPAADKSQDQPQAERKSVEPKARTTTTGTKRSGAREKAAKPDSRSGGSRGSSGGGRSPRSNS